MIKYRTLDIEEILSNREGKVVCIPTNLNVKKNGQAVMGAGLAKILALRYPEIPIKLGDRIRCGSPWVGYIYYDSYSMTHFVSVPTKYDWKQKSNLELIRKSLRELSEIFEVMIPFDVYVPKLGCGMGGFSWDKIKPVMEEYLYNKSQSYIIFDKD